MILIGINSAIDCEKEFTVIENFKELSKTKSNSLVITEFRKDDIELYNSDILMGITVKSLLEFIFLINTNVRYAVCTKEIAKYFKSVLTLT